MTRNDISAQHAGGATSEFDATMRLNAIANGNDDVEIKDFRSISLSIAGSYQGFLYN